MLACISQFYQAYEETLNTIKYAQRASKIKNNVQKNYREIETSTIEKSPKFTSEYVTNLQTQVQQL